MKRLAIIAAAALGIAAVASACIQNAGFTRIGSHDVFAGEIQNDTSADILAHDVLVAFLDSDGDVVDTEEVESCLRSLQSGETDFFSVESEESYSDTTSAIGRVDSDSLEFGDTADGDFELTDITVERDEDGEILRVDGTITNLDEEDLDDPAVCAVVYDDDGNVVVVAKDEDIDDLAEDESATFSLEIDVPDSTSTVDHVDVWADGIEDDTPVDPVSEEDLDVAICEATATPTNTATSTSTATGTPTDTPTATDTPIATDTPDPSATSTPTATATDTPTATATAVCE